MFNVVKRVVVVSVVAEGFQLRGCGTSKPVAVGSARKSGGGQRVANLYPRRAAPPPPAAPPVSVPVPGVVQPASSRVRGVDPEVVRLRNGTAAENSFRVQQRIASGPIAACRAKNIQERAQLDMLFRRATRCSDGRYEGLGYKCAECKSEFRDKTAFIIAHKNNRRGDSAFARFEGRQIYELPLGICQAKGVQVPDWARKFGARPRNAGCFYMRWDPDSGKWNADKAPSKSGAKREGYQEWNVCAGKWVPVPAAPSAPVAAPPAPAAAVDRG